MPFIKHEKEKMVIGLSWNQLTQKSIGAEAVNLAEHESSPYGVIHKIKGEEGPSNFLGLTSNKADVGKISAATVFSSIVENGMILDRSSEKHAWWCASIGHQILTQTDKVYELDDITNPEHDFIQFIEEALGDILESGDVEDFKIYAHPDLAELVQDLVGEVTVVSMSISDLISDSGSKFPKDFSKNKIKKVGGTHPFVITALGVIAIGSCYYFFFHDPSPSQVDIDMSGLSQLKEPSNRVSDIVQETPPSEKDREILNAALEQEKRWLEYDVSKLNLKTITQKVLDVYEAMPLFAAGWDLSTITYQDSLHEDKIIVDWKKDFGTPDDLRNYWEFNKDVEIEFRLDGQNASLLIPIDDDGVRTMGYDEKYRNYKDSNYSFENLMSDFDRLNLSWSMGINPEPPRRETIEGLFDDSLSDKKQLSIKRYSFEISDDGGIAGIKKAVGVSDKSDLIIAKSVKINVLKDFEWIIKGELYDVN